MLMVAHFVIVAVLLLYPIDLFSQTAIVAVIDFEGKGVSEIEASALTDRLRTEIINMGKAKVVERGEMDEILKEQGFQQSGCVSSECMVEAGRLLGANQIVGGSISKIGNTFSVSARIIDIETGEIVNSVNYDYSGVIDELLISGMRNVSQLLFLAERETFIELDKDVEYYDNGKIKSEGRTVARRKHGRWIYYHGNGRIEKVGNFKDGKEVGTWTFYYDNGRTQKVGNFKDGNEVGTWTFYYDNGRIQKVGDFEQGKKTGKWKYYDKNGDVRIIEKVYDNSFFDKLAKNGRVFEYYPNGKVKSEVSVRSGRWNGIRKVWGTDGELLSESLFQRGEGRYVNTHQNGVVKVSGYGVIAEDGEVIKRMGIWVNWDDRGNVISEILYDNNGHLMSVKNYR